MQRTAISTRYALAAREHGCVGLWRPVVTPHSTSAIVYLTSQVNEVILTTAAVKGAVTRSRPSPLRLVTHLPSQPEETSLSEIGYLT